MDRPHRVDWSTGAVALLDEARPWAGGEHVRRAGVSSFGMSGTNAHLILEQAPAPTRPATATPSRRPPSCPCCSPPRSRPRSPRRRRTGWPVGSATTSRALDVAWSSVVSRATLDQACGGASRGPHRSAGGLRSLAADAPSGTVVAGQAGDRGPLAVLFSGQARSAPAWAASCTPSSRLCRRPRRGVQEHLDRGCRAAQGGAVRAGGLCRGGAAGPDRVHPGRALRRRGGAVPPRGVVRRGAGLRGRDSIGEIAAAHVAGVLSLQDACLLVAARGRLMQSLPDGGGMLAVAADEAAVTSRSPG
ncbi:ketoacyl-synthetase C-terminal extension domain-containing protein [Micromonospora sp. BRA006-A]|nr:ketoacyl-synthetase C-terminal extension domain-containing protein [Micromonospora sp. BRA006-A]